MIHAMTLTYTVDDDGVWLECSCKFRRRLGHDATPADVADAAEAHTRTKAAAEQRALEVLTEQFGPEHSGTATPSAHARRLMAALRAARLRVVEATS